MAALPIAIGIGAGARRTIGMAVVGGALLTTRDTLSHPVFFTMLRLHDGRRACGSPYSNVSISNVTRVNCVRA
jgi:hypothetical protein